MTDSWIPALIAAVGVVVAATISILAGRGRLHRIETLSRVLNNLPPDDPARAPLAKVLVIEAEALRDAQESVFAALARVSVIGLLLTLILAEFGEPLRTLAPSLYIVLALTTGLLLLVIALGYTLAALQLLHRAGRAIITRWRNRQGFHTLPRRGSDGAPPKEREVRLRQS